MKANDLATYRAERVKAKESLDLFYKYRKGLNKNLIDKDYTVGIRNLKKSSRINNLVILVKYWTVKTKLTTFAHLSKKNSNVCI